MGISVSGTTLGDMKMMLMPLPPQREQNKLVKKVDELLKVCDALEKEIKQNQKLSQQFLQSVLKEALEPKDN